MRERIRARIDELQPRVVEVRRDLHRHPELGFEEVRTSGLVAEALGCLGGLSIRTGVARTGIVARLRGEATSIGPRRTVALRADMDALPVQDQKRGPLCSGTPGKMHACGHDAHTAMLLGAAQVLSELRAELPGDVVFLFQPAEEGPGGAEPMIAEGALDGVDFVLGQHCLPSLAAGEIGVSDGAALAATDAFELRIRGVGGHGAYPHLTTDAIVVAAQVVTALQTIVSRTVDPLAAAVVTIGTIQGGYNFNVVADVVEMKGTVRTLDPALHEAIPKRLEAIVAGVCAAHGARYELDYRRKYPATVNHAEGTSLVRAVGRALLGPAAVHELRPSMGGEDFAYYLQRVPGCFWWLGVRHPSPEHPGYGLHHPAFDIDEEALKTGVAMLVEGALAYLSCA
jgi:amidohydrolase